MKKTIHTIITIGLFIFSIGEARMMRATEATSSPSLEPSRNATEELIVEFRKGDMLPVTFFAKGDFFETEQPDVFDVTVRQNFWLKLGGDNVYMSLDGITFSPINEFVSGNLSAGASSDQSGGLANAIELNLEAYLK